MARMETESQRQEAPPPMCSRSMGTGKGLSSQPMAESTPAPTAAGLAGAPGLGERDAGGARWQVGDRSLWVSEAGRVSSAPRFTAVFAGLGELEGAFRPKCGSLAPDAGSWAEGGMVVVINATDGFDGADLCFRILRTFVLGVTSMELRLGSQAPWSPLCPPSVPPLPAPPPRWLSLTGLSGGWIQPFAHLSQKSNRLAPVSQL